MQANKNEPILADRLSEKNNFAMLPIDLNGNIIKSKMLKCRKNMAKVINHECTKDTAAFHRDTNQKRNIIMAKNNEGRKNRT